jgi:hypothetical protein
MADIKVSIAGMQDLEQAAQQQYKAGNYKGLVDTLTQAIERVGLYAYLIEQTTYYCLALAAEPLTEEHMGPRSDAGPMKGGLVVYKAVIDDLLYDLAAVPGIQPRLSYDVYRYTMGGEIVLLDRAHSIATALAITTLCFN